VFTKDTLCLRVSQAAGHQEREERNSPEPAYWIRDNGLPDAYLLKEDYYLFKLLDIGSGEKVKYGKSAERQV